MKSKASAPGKIILFGEHFVVYGIKAILCAIDRRVTVTSEFIPEKKILIKSNIGELDLPIHKSINEVNSPLKPLYYLANKMIEKNNSHSGIKVLVESEIPSGVGLGSSSACCVAGAASITRLFEKINNDKVLGLAIEAEKTIFENTSGADCTVCTFGGLLQYDKYSGFSKIDSEVEFYLVIANSQIKHSTDSIVSNVKKFKENNEEKFHELCQRESELIDQVLDMLKNNNLKGLGKNMNRNQGFLEEIGVSNEKLKEMIQVAENTSYGAKITGAGGGGCVISLTDKINLAKTLSALRKKNYECFPVKIDFEGLYTF